MSIQKFIKGFCALDNSKSTSEKFWDFCELGFCAYAKLTAHQKRAEELETRYMQIVSSYKDKDTIRAYPEFLVMVMNGVIEGEDFLGKIAMEIGALDAKTGQFFTPLPVSRMMAEITLIDASNIIDTHGYITVNEPTSGAGGMVLAMSKTLENKGYIPNHHMLVNAQDISRLCYHMCFLQLSFAGIPAFVERCDTLKMERFDCAWTPATVSFYKRHGRLF